MKKGYEKNRRAVTCKGAHQLNERFVKRSYSMARRFSTRIDTQLLQQNLGRCSIGECYFISPMFRLNAREYSQMRLLLWEFGILRRRLTSENESGVPFTNESVRKHFILRMRSMTCLKMSLLPLK